MHFLLKMPKNKIKIKRLYTTGWKTLKIDTTTKIYLQQMFSIIIKENSQIISYFKTMI